MSMPYDSTPSSAAAEVFAFNAADHVQQVYDRVRRLAREHTDDRVVGLCTMAVMACADARADFEVGLSVVKRGTGRPARSAAAERFWRASTTFSFDRWRERSYELAPRVKEWMEQSQAKLSLVANANLREWHKLVVPYVAGEITLAEFLTRLFPEAERPATVDAYLATVVLERAIDFGAADREHGAFLTMLWPVLESNESQRFLEVGISARLRDIPTSAYHDICAQLARTKNIDTAAFSHMLKYFDYIKTAEGISFKAMFDVMWQAIVNGYTQRVRSGVEARATADFLEWYLVERVLSQAVGELSLVRIPRREVNRETELATMLAWSRKRRRQVWMRRLRWPVAVGLALAVALVALAIGWIDIS